MPWEKLRDGMAAGGWLDLSNQRGKLNVGGLDIVVAGVHDPRTKQDRYAQVAGRADPSADLRVGVIHSPEPRLLDQFVADGYDLLLAGHTHGGQLCLPWYGTLVTNCGIDRERARGLHRYPADGQFWLHVSAGLGRHRRRRPGSRAAPRLLCSPSYRAIPADSRRAYLVQPGAFR